MLQTLTIQNVALISNITIDFGEGFNVLMGETGAGKSIIFDSINFVLGDKIDKSLLRSNEKSMRVDALFSNISENAKEKLSELGYDGDEIVLSRTYSIEGKSTCRINGFPCIAANLKEIGEVLLDSYSQHENIQLLKTKNHLSMIDKYGEKKISSIKENLKNIFEEYKELDKQINSLGGNGSDRERELSILEYQIKEIEDAELEEGELEDLQERLKILNNSEKIFETVSNCENLISEGGACVINSLRQVSHFLSSLNIDLFEESKERIESCLYEIEDISQVLSDIKNSSEYDENEFNRIDNRIDLIKSLNKKYGGSVEKTLEFLEEAKNRYNLLQDSEATLANLDKKKKEVYSKILELCEKLSFERKQVAKIVENKIINELQELGMKSSKFEVSFKKLENISANGYDDVEFVFSANKGQEVKALTKTASGGELSRFMLAIKNIFSEIGEAQTLIFDEIDAGISGETGNIIGRKLQNITKNSQIICITHLPQVACYGDDFFYVSKEEDDKTTKTAIKHIEGDEILQSIAKLVVGDKVSQTALQQAKELRIKAGK